MKYEIFILPRVHTFDSCITNLSLLSGSRTYLLYPSVFFCRILSSFSKSKLYYDRRSAGQSVLEQSTHFGDYERSWFLSDSCGFVGLRRPLWREDGSAVCNCNWPSPAQSFSGPSSVGLVAIFYCLRFETFLFVASYDSQDHGGGIRSRLHTGDSALFWSVLSLR
jgi:hypothetical protein